MTKPFGNDGKGFMGTGDNAGHANYPYAQKAPWNTITVAFAWANEDGSRGEEEARGTLGDYFDLLVEQSELTDDEATEITATLIKGETHLLGGGAFATAHLYPVEG